MIEKILNFIKSQKSVTWLAFLGLYLISSGLSALVFSFVSVKGAVINLNPITQHLKTKQNLPKNQACPINGLMYTQPEKEIWNTRRPIAAMIENHADSRPQSGLSSADIVYEGVAEGGITRFLSIFYCATAAGDIKIAPIRSARIYFVNLAAGYGLSPIFLHQGGANDFCSDCPGGVKPYGQVAPKVNAYAALDKLGWRNGGLGNDFDGGFNVGFPVVARDQYRLGSEPSAWEHAVVADIDEVYKEAAKRSFNYRDGDGNPWTQGFKSWKFDDGLSNPKPSVLNISFHFWENQPDYDVEWKYDSASNTYKRFNGGKAHTDWNFDKPQISASDVVVMFVKEQGPVDEEKHMYYEVVGEGKALIFKNGTVVEGTWRKDSQLDREVFYDKNGAEIVLTRGPVWVELVPAGNSIKY
jgi:hypothetical protein